jgi:Uma2 family endonuclease
MSDGQGYVDEAAAKVLDDWKMVELIDGQVLRTPSSGLRASSVAVALIALLVEYERAEASVYVFTRSLALHLFPSRPDYFRRADATVVLRSRLPDGLTDDDLRIAPDVVAEVVGLETLAANLDEKIADYLAAGVRMIWVIYPGTRTVMVYRPGVPVLRLTPPRSLYGFDILPGFSHRAGRLFYHGLEGDQDYHRIRGTVQCPCCHYWTLFEPARWEICPVCFWEDDGQGDADADEVFGGPNGSESLTTARANYLRIGAAEERCLGFVREPHPWER